MYDETMRKLDELQKKHQLEFERIERSVRRDQWLAGIGVLFCVASLILSLIEGHK